MNHLPDKWVMLKIHSDKFGTIYKILSSWYGGFGGSDSWKLSSGTMGITELEHSFILPQHSGSTYTCHKASYGMNSYTTGILRGWVPKMEGIAEITVLDMSEITNIKDWG